MQIFNNDIINLKKIDVKRNSFILNPKFLLNKFRSGYTCFYVKEKFILKQLII